MFSNQSDKFDLNWNPFDISSEVLQTSTTKRRLYKKSRLILIRKTVDIARMGKRRVSVVFIKEL